MELRWGFVGAGRVVHRFLEGIKLCEDAIPHAIYARDRSKGESVAANYGIPLVFDSFDSFLLCDEIDIVYIAVTHPYHKEFAEKCLRAKKPVLCEKPIAPNYAQASSMINCARENNTFLMEAMWTRAFPLTKQVQRWIKEGRVGRVIGANGFFTIKAPNDENGRLRKPSEAGGSLLDIGVYLISYMHMLFGSAPAEIASLANIDENGVDTDAGVVMRFADKLATIFFSFNTEGPDTITIYGTDGIIEVFKDFWRPRSARLTCSEGIIDFSCPIPDSESIYGNNISFAGEGFQFEIKHVHECIEKGLKESPLITLDQSLDIISTCDRLRQAWGEKYPFEK